MVTVDKGAVMPRSTKPKSYPKDDDLWADGIFTGLLLGVFGLILSPIVWFLIKSGFIESAEDEASPRP